MDDSNDILCFPRRFLRGATNCFLIAIFCSMYILCSLQIFLIIHLTSPNFKVAMLCLILHAFTSFCINRILSLLLGGRNLISCTSSCDLCTFVMWCLHSLSLKQGRTELLKDLHTRSSLYNRFGLLGGDDVNVDYAVSRAKSA